VSDDRLWEEPVQVKFRPSYSTTTLYCPGSLLPSLAMPDSSGWAAAEGTLFHRIVAEWQMTGERPDYLLGQEFTIDGHLVTVDAEMFVHAQACLERYADIPGQPQIEVRVDISSLTPIPGQSGTADRVHVYPGTVEIIDWKYGKGVQVFANWNSQLLCYAMGIVDKFGDEFVIERIRIHIAQPRLDHFDVWEISRDELELWAFWARAQWVTAWQPQAPRTPSGKACQWCRVRIDCPARQVMLERLVADTFEEVVTSDQQQVALSQLALTDLPPPVTLPTERLAWIYRYRRTFELWFKEIGEELIRRGQQGEDVSPWKVVEGRQGNRAWVDESEAATAIAKLGISPWADALATPAEIERRLAHVGIRKKPAKEFLALYTDRASGKLTLVPDQDNRQALSAVVEETFDGDKE
jgi:hypothetical protein